MRGPLGEEETVAKRISGIVLALILAVPYLAEAECAWVLWQNTEFVAHEPSGLTGIRIAPPPGTSPPKGNFYTEWNNAHWTPDSSYTSLQNCDASARLVSKPWPTGVKYGDGRAIYRCLPDTVDPRGPKGK